MNEKSEQFDDVPLDSDSADQVHLAVNDAERALRAASELSASPVVGDSATELDALSLDALDARRYRAMRQARFDEGQKGDPDFPPITFDEMDSAIDAAMAQESS